MEDFTTSTCFQNLLKPPGASSSFSEISSNNMELLNSFSHDVLNNQQPLSSNLHGVLDFSTGLQFSLAGHGRGSQQGLLCPFDQGSNHLAQSLPSILGLERHDKNAIPMSEFIEIPSSSGLGSEIGGNIRSDKNNGISARKRKRKMEGEVEKPREVVHVRAKRGQATDSHSLAERVRRERINDKLRVLQDLVPGCYKTMGMAVMLDVIINYVRSLQNQIDFLSMKLSAASLFYDFNSPEAEALETLKKTASSFEAHVMKRMAGEGYNGGTMPWVQSTWPF